MTSADIEAIISAIAPDMAQDLGLEPWRVNFSSGATAQPHWVADSTINSPYQRAGLRFENRKHNTREEVIDSVRHELVHVVLAEMTHYREVVRATLRDNTSEDAMERRVWTFALERTTYNVERALDGWAQRTRRELEEETADAR